MRKTFQCKLYSSKRTKHLDQMLRAAKDIWNHSFALHRRCYSIYKKHLNKYRLQKHIAKLRKRNPHWRCLGSQAVQGIVERIDKAYQRFFKKQGHLCRLAMGSPADCLAS